MKVFLWRFLRPFSLEIEGWKLEKVVVNLSPHLSGHVLTFINIECDQACNGSDPRTRLEVQAHSLCQTYWIKTKTRRCKGCERAMTWNFLHSCPLHPGRPITLGMELAGYNFHLKFTLLGNYRQNGVAILTVGAPWLTLCQALF